MQPGKPSEYSGRANSKVNVHVNLADPRGIFVLDSDPFDGELTTNLLNLGGKAVEALAPQLEAGEPVIEQLLVPVANSPGSYIAAEGVHVKFISTRGADMGMTSSPLAPLVIREYPLPEGASPEMS